MHRPDPAQAERRGPRVVGERASVQTIDAAPRRTPTIAHARGFTLDARSLAPSGELKQ